MFSNQKKKQQNRRLLNQLFESDADFIFGQSSYKNHTKSRIHVADRLTILYNLYHPTQIKGPRLDIHTLEKNIVNKVPSEVDRVMTKVETRVQDAVLTATENLVIPRVEIAKNSVNATSGYGLVVLCWVLIRENFQGTSKALR